MVPCAVSVALVSGVSLYTMSAGDVLNVRWGYSDRSEEHTGYIPLHYLRKHSYSVNALQRRQDAERPVVAVSSRYTKPYLIGRS